MFLPTNNQNGSIGEIEKSAAQSYKKRTNLSIDCAKIKALIKTFDSDQNNKHYNISSICNSY